jgi:transcriptional regulator with XRE-family HTH domain
MGSVGDRLRDERERLGLNQTAFGAIGGVQKQAQLKYEKGERFPDAGYLAAVDRFGADVQYIVTGKRSAQALTEDEDRLITLFRAAPLAVKAATMAGLAAGGASATVGNSNSGSGAQQINSGSGAQQSFVNSPVGNVAAGDLIIGQGNKK